MDDHEQQQFESQFNSAFVGPQWQHIKSERGRDLWIDTEVLRDSLAGPLYNIAMKGNCSYVYSREDRYFKGVDDPEGLKNRLREFLDELVEAIDQFGPRTADELSDQASVYKNASDIWAAVEAAIEIERRHYKNSNLVTD
ncbi:MAG: hypothetical protein ACJAVZ_004894 [Afipia broomeae]|jgi:hypothetical protein|nr:hypothetical protein A8B75_16985 [Sphingomonadales bacterium EhC05]PHR18054.1 MAG: hypothetical protein COA41_11000 [Sphingopyxis sp.]|tara:strand:+ start:143 stop:562 length:420 start_codon:yes stop_codon:yes gene_type:complete